MKNYRFYKNELGWFIDLPKFPFNKAWLAMVAGADDLLDKLAEGKSEITLGISTSPKYGWDDKLERVKKLGLFRGAIYSPTFNRIYPEIFEGHNFLWLCPATLWVFLYYPKYIYFKKI